MQTQTIRTFLAVEVSDEVREILSKLGRDFNGFSPGLSRAVRLVQPKNAHLTLKFLGDTPQEKIQVIAQDLRNRLATFPTFSYTIQGTGVFPNPKRPRILWLGISSGGKSLQNLHQQVERTLQPFGFEPENRTFKPHLTVGRIKLQKSKKGKINDLNPGSFLTWSFDKIIVPVNRVIFFKSKLKPEGAQYYQLHAFDLKL